MKEINVLTMQNALIGSSMLALLSLHSETLASLLTNLSMSLVATSLSQVNLSVVMQMFGSNNKSYRKILDKAIVNALKESYQKSNERHNVLEKYRFLYKCSRLLNELNSTPGDIFEANQLEQLITHPNSIIEKNSLTTKFLLNFGFNTQTINSFLDEFNSAIAKHFYKELSNKENHELWSEYLLIIFNSASVKASSENNEHFSALIKELKVLKSLIKNKNANFNKVITIKEKLAGPTGFSKKIDKKIDIILDAQNTTYQKLDEIFNAIHNKTLIKLILRNKILFFMILFCLALFMPVYHSPYEEDYSLKQQETIAGLKKFKMQFDEKCEATIKESITAQLDNLMNHHEQMQTSVDIDQLKTPLGLSLSFLEYTKLFDECKEHISIGKNVFDSHVEYLLNQIEEFISPSVQKTGWAQNSQTKWTLVTSAIFNSGKMAFQSKSSKSQIEVEYFNRTFNYLMSLMEEQHLNYSINLNRNDWYYRTTVFRLSTFLLKTRQPTNLVIDKSDIIRSMGINAFNINSDMASKINEGKAVLFIVDSKTKDIKGTFKLDTLNKNKYIFYESDGSFKNTDSFICLALDFQFFNEIGYIEYRLGPIAPYELVENNLAHQIGIYFYIPGYYYVKTEDGIWANTRKPQAKDLINKKQYLRKMQNH